MTDQSEWTKAVVKVGGGRGFVTETDRERLVITAAHCLPHLPARDGFAEERTYAKLLGRIERKRTPVWAECLFVDPIADLAVLGSPDNQELWEEAADYEALVGAAIPLSIGDFTLIRPPHTLRGGETVFGRPQAECSGWLLSLDRRWFRCDVTAYSRGMNLTNPAEAVVSGMSGSPVVRDDGTAIGLACLSFGSSLHGGPLLSRHLPRWLFEELPGRW
jgi:hypothetical protein